MTFTHLCYQECRNYNCQTMFISNRKEVRHLLLKWLIELMKLWMNKSLKSKIMKLTFTLLFSAFILLSSAQEHKTPVPLLTTNFKTNQQLLNEFQDMKFGMFVHWGPVSLKGTEIGWSRGREVPNEEYDNLYKQSVSYTHLRAHETDSYLVCRL